MNVTNTKESEMTTKAPAVKKTPAEKREARNLTARNKRADAKKAKAQDTVNKQVATIVDKTAVARATPTASAEPVGTATPPQDVRDEMAATAASASQAQAANDDPTPAKKPLTKDAVREIRMGHVKAIKKYATDHYDTDGWDVIVEAMTDEEILTDIVRAAWSLNGAMKNARKFVGALEEARLEAVNA
jgi:hypothetical protein